VSLIRLRINILDRFTKQRQAFVVANFIKITDGIDVEPLRKAIESKSHLWGQITARQTTPGSPHHETECIFLRWCDGQDVHSAFNDLRAVNYPAYAELPEANALIAAVYKASEAKELGRVIIVNLKPLGFITPHADEGAYADHYERFHLPLTSDSDRNTFFVENNKQHGEYCMMRDGEVWWFNHKKVHTALNDSGYPRWHLIVDVVAPKYRVERQES
jgi:hypothetical protein